MALKMNLADHNFSVDLLTCKGGGKVWVDKTGYNVQLVTRADGTRVLVLDGVEFPVHVACDGDRAFVHALGQSWEVNIEEAGGKVSAGAKSDITSAPMPGTIIDIRVKTGAVVTKGQTLLVIESMKMQTSILSARDGIVAEVPLAKGQTFDKGALLVRLEPEGKQSCAA